MKVVLARLILVVVGALFAVSALEVGLRVLRPDPRILRPDARLGHAPQPHLDVLKTFGGHERVVRITTNSLGLRGPEITPPAPGERRILALGDSFTFGHAVEYDEAWPAVLQRLASRNGGSYRVVNAGISGHGTGQQLLLYQALQERVQPDVVVLAFTVVNDVLDNLCIDEATRARRVDTPCFSLEGDKLAFHPPTRVADATPSSGFNSRALGFFASQAKRLTLWNPKMLHIAEAAGVTVKLPYVPETVVSWYDERYQAAGWKLTQRLLLELRNAAAARKTEIVILLVPASLQVDRGRHDTLAILGGGYPAVRAYFTDPTRPQRLFAELCASARLDCVDPLPNLLATEPRERTYYAIDGHWTPVAHRIAAEMVAARLREREVLK